MAGSLVAWLGNRLGWLNPEVKDLVVIYDVGKRDRIASALEEEQGNRLCVTGILPEIPKLAPFNQRWHPVAPPSLIVLDIVRAARLWRPRV